MLRRVHTPQTTPFLKMSVRETVSEFNAFVDTFGNKFLFKNISGTPLKDMMKMLNNCILTQQRKLHCQLSDFPCSELIYS